jgi:hypothetical protein
MKTYYYLLISVFAAMLAFAGCEKNEAEPTSEECYVGYYAFVENYINNLGFTADYTDDYIKNFLVPKDDKNYTHLVNSLYTMYGQSFFLKGILEEHILYGAKVKVLEDLKGNFADSVFISVWGKTGNASVDNYRERLDDLTQYAISDTLLLMLLKCSLYEDELTPLTPPEKSDDFSTFEYAVSVLKISNGYVTGKIHTVLQKSGNDEIPSISNETETMLWTDLQEELRYKLTHPSYLE